jgi:integrase
MATVYEREGALQINFRYNGKRHRVNTGLPLTKHNSQVCEAQAAALDSAIKRERMGMGKVELAEFFPDHFKPRPTTLGRYFEEWLECRNIRPHTRGDYLCSWRQLAPFLKDLPIGEVNMLHLEQVTKALRDRGLQPNTIKARLKPLRSCLRHAYNAGLLPRLPVGSPEKGTNKTDIHPFNREELRDLLAFIKVRTPNYYNLAVVMAFTGMRPAELGGLQWGDMDWKAKQISVQRGRVDGQVFEPKTANSVRRIDMLPEVEAALKRQREATMLRGAWVFLSPKGRPLDGNSLTSWWGRSVMKDYPGKRRNLYQLRHTFASMMIAAGEDVAWVAKIMGHVTPQITYNYYVRFIEGQDVTHGEKFLAGFGQL